jgi:hypothetical protein
MAAEKSARTASVLRVARVVDVNPIARVRHAHETHAMGP